MDYKTILVHVDDSAHVDARIEVAATLAVSNGAHLIGAALTGVSRFIEQAVAANPYDPAITPYLDTLKSRAIGALDRFEESALRHGVVSMERRLLDDVTTADIARQARYCDIAIVGQSDPGEYMTTVGKDFPEHVAVGSGTPVLIVPFARNFPKVGSRILVAWNGSREAKHALQGALPLLKYAKAVTVVIFNPGDGPDRHGGQPATDVTQYLSRHGVTASLRTQTVAPGEIGNALLSIVAEASFDLLVMGCYGHSRFRELLLGGVTRAILASMTLPVLMSH